MKRWITVLAALATVAGCASPSYYQAADNGKGRYFGYADRQVDGPLHRINFIASPVASFDQTYAFAIYRAAELAQSKGATYFEVLEGPINKDAIERFIGQATAANIRAFDGKELDGINIAYANTPRSGFIYGGSPLLMPVAAYQSPTYIYVPVQPPPPPVQISLLIRLLNAPSFDASKGFDVNALLTRLGPKIIRPPVKAA